MKVLVIDGILLSIIVGLIRGGNFKGIAHLQLKFGWIFPLLLVLQIVVYVSQNRVEWIGNISNYFFILIYIVGMLFLWINRKHEGFTILLLGVFLNFLVMAINGGRMPVSVEAASILDPNYLQALEQNLASKHTILTSSTYLPFLADIIPLQPPYPREQVISIGDIVMNVGIFIFIQKLMQKEKAQTSVE